MRWNLFSAKQTRASVQAYVPETKYWEYFRHRAHEVARIANVEAKRDESVACTGYLLLGLLRVADPDCLSLLHQLGVDAETLCSYVEEHVLEVQETRVDGKEAAWWLSMSGREVLQTAWREARALGCAKVDTPHLLWGLVAEESTWAAQTLAEYGVPQEVVRAFLGRLYGQSLLTPCLPPMEVDCLLRVPVQTPDARRELLRADSEPS